MLNLSNTERKEFEIFNYKNLGTVRTKLDEHGNPWFCLADVCSILGIGNSRDVVNRLFEKGVDLIDTLTPGGVQSVIFIDEPNLYKAIMGSRKQEAQEFQNWICYEVIPMIRRTGAYMTPETFLQLQQDPNFVRTLAENYITAYDQVQYL